MVRFYEHVDDDLLRFAVIIAEYRGMRVWCKHKERDTFEIPGGHREPGERIGDTAHRELTEETGAIDFEIEPVCVYSVTAPDNFDGKETFGMLFHAVIRSFGEIHSEIERIELFDGTPARLTYPDIQPKLTEEWERRKTGRKA